MIGSSLGARERSPDPQRLEPGELTPVHQRASRRSEETRLIWTAPYCSGNTGIRNPRRNLFDSNSHCRNVEYQRTPTLCAIRRCTVLRLQPPVAVHRLRAAHLFKEI
ncbi:hypothetical protein HPB52_025688 [Rhipicephalus sanguineus]|uniref:Uncharacterized protein n=1 Tax=Rhipicephalus sanguineus TaxID=34632 RepID=A0A9D4TCR3_RHISA|nr:hypothetical protein HPB52_025688 [Rhipicephalus sanguineus]